MYTCVLSVRIRREIKEEAMQLKINIRKVVKEALKREIEEEKRRRLERAVENILKLMGNIGEEDWVKMVRECREGR